MEIRVGAHETGRGGGLSKRSASRCSASSVRLRPEGAQVGPALSPSSLDFGTETVGSTSPSQTLTLTVATPSIVTVVSVVGDFVLTGGTCQPDTDVAPSSPCTVDVAFAPVGPGVTTGDVTVVVGSGLAASATLSGEGSTATTTVPSTTPETTTTTTAGEPAFPTTTRRPGVTVATIPPDPIGPTTSGSSTTTLATRPPTTRPPPPTAGPTLDVTALGGGRSGPPGVGLTVVGTGYQAPDGGTLGHLVLIASGPSAQAQVGPPCTTVYFFLDGRRLGSAVPTRPAPSARTGLSVPGDAVPASTTSTSACAASGGPCWPSAASW